MGIHPSVQSLLTEIDAFCVSHRLSPTDFGKKALNDGKFVGDLRERGRTPSLATIDRVKSFLAPAEKERAA